MVAAGGIGYRFRAEHRLSKTDEFSSVFAFRRSFRGMYFHLSYRPNGSSGARLGLVVAKKLAGRAVTRNLVKRLVREAFRHAFPSLPGCDVVLRLVRPVAAGDRAALRQDADALFARLTG